jgi:CRP/FNR family transcriptional regulator
VFRISARALIAAARRDARVAWAIAEELNRRLGEVLEQTAVNAFGSVRQCVAAHLLDLAARRAAPRVTASWPTAPARVPVPAALPGWGQRTR